jgi:ATP-dependent protease ClpP protease subunit
MPKSMSRTRLALVFLLDSAGGQVEEGDRVIEILKEIKLGHQLITVVFRHKLYASMCILIFLQGHGRRAARASLWIFHEAARWQTNGDKQTDMAESGGCSANTISPPGSQ